MINIAQASQPLYRSPTDSDPASFPSSQSRDITNGRTYTVRGASEAPNAYVKRCQEVAKKALPLQ